MPNLGVVSLGDERNFVIADIPGIIEGAAQGQGLGLQFLRHVERTRVLLHIITWDPDPEREPVKDFDVLMSELRTFDAELAERPMIIGIGKLDLEETRTLAERVAEELRGRGLEVFTFSAATQEGVESRPLAPRTAVGRASHRQPAEEALSQRQRAPRAARRRAHQVGRRGLSR